MFKKSFCTFAALIAFSAGSASAATFNFLLDSRDDVFAGGSLSYSSGGVDLTVTGGGNNVVNAVNGLGVNSRPSTGEPDNALITLGEVLTFTVGPRPINSLISVVFEGGTESERIDVVIDGVRAQYTLPSERGASRVSLDLTPLLNRGTTQFSFFGVEEKEVERRRGVLISGLEVSIVPVPAAILSFGTGLALLGGLGRFGKRSRRKWMVA